MAGLVFGARMSETMSETNGNKLLFCRHSEAAFGTESATRGAGSGVRGARSGVW